MITALAFSVWFAEFVLETRGAFKSFQRKLYPLFAVLSVCALGDGASFAVRLVSTDLYAYAYWIQKGAKYVLLAILAGFVCGKLIDDSERRHVWITAILITVAGGFFVGSVYSHGHTWTARLMDSGITANMFLAAIIGVAWFSRETELDGAWKWIAGGLCLLLWWDGTMTMIWRKWYPARHLFWMGEIAALIIWNYAARATFKLSAARVPLQARGEAVELAKAAS